MKKIPFLFLYLFYCGLTILAQTNLSDTLETDSSQALYFISDTQKPMTLEKLFLKSHHNKKATSILFQTIISKQPKNLFMLGDIVALGFDKPKWKRVDRFLDTMRSNGSTVEAILGNHEVMYNKKRGEKNFQKRFPNSVRTGYVSIVDSVGIVLLNSNFKILNEAEQKLQTNWYKHILDSLDAAPSIKCIIVCCHHAPYTNSTIVKSNLKVQQYFVPDYLQSKKAMLFITGHAHAFEHFNFKGKDFVVIGGGGGLHQPLDTSANRLNDLAPEYKPLFHYLTVKRITNSLMVQSVFLKPDFSGVEQGYKIKVSVEN